MKIDIDYSSIKIDVKGIMTGLIHLSIDEILFPEKGWNDFILINTSVQNK